ncbi:MAG: hypothetical protein H6897_06830 [Rhodobacteraceae bacterium]|jgi:hypothetical protein|uniref:hypothetical protein n=1 Tax=Albidovulum sp. TaxID=1872424 RepID=UPI001DC5BB1E|nr:hypothetical protein [uncultured Defluviimonas sp.]MCB2124740.1 hypothetical protein [Paracoccaceae bacterium]MCC0069628.1 hypothetical protein [Paracoccaceae bacterium]
MTDLVEKARLGRTNALAHISGAARMGHGCGRDAVSRHSVPFAFVSSRAKLGGR